MAGDDVINAGELLAEQRDFYRADAEPFDRWLGALIDESNEEVAARTYRAGRARFQHIVRKWAPLGEVLEIAAGTGRLAELYLPHASSSLLLDSSPESLRLAAARLAGTSPAVSFVEADVFEWDAGGQKFDTIIFSAWLHHVPHSHFGTFWRRVDALLAGEGRVIFDFPDVEITPPGRVEIPDEPTKGYGFYAPVDGVSIRDHFGRRWRVVHNLWDTDELGRRLADLGWALTVRRPGLFNNIVWASAHRQPDHQ